MKPELVALLACPVCKGNLVCVGGLPSSAESLDEGTMSCGACRRTFAIVGGVPRFVPARHYTDSFGFQWNQHTETQLDSRSGSAITRARFADVTGWTNLEGQRVLEVGCGSGRFTQVALETGAEVFSVDASLAVDANRRNNGGHPNLHLLQADLYQLPFPEGSFDKVFCLGVLQHCPDVERAFKTLARFVKPGGELVVDVYDLTFRALVNPKYWLRPITRRLPHEALYRFVKTVVPVVYPLKHWVHERIPRVGPYLAFLIPVAYHKGYVPGAEKLSHEQLVEWSILDTFDKLAPAYDQPQRIGAVRRWFQEAGLRNAHVRYGPNGIVGRGSQPLRAPTDQPRVAFLWHGDRNIGGGEYGTCLLAQSLSPEFNPLLIYGRRNVLVDQYEQSGIEVVHLDLSPRLTGVYRDQVTLSPLRMIERGWHFARAVVRVVGILRAARVQILHPVDNLSKLIAVPAARLAGVRVVTHCREELGATWVERLLIRYQARFMDRVIAVADRIAGQFRRNGIVPGHVTTIHNGIDAMQFDPDAVRLASDVDWSWKPARVGIGIIATFDQCKGHAHLFQALARLKKTGMVGWHCLVVGDGREREGLTAQVAELDLGRDVTFLGYRRNVAEILKGLDIVVIPSEHEGLPRVALEAMAMKVPLIATRVGGIPEVVVHDQTGLLVLPGDTEGLARALCELIESPSKRHAMGARGRERVIQQFSLEHNVAKTIDVYQQLLQHS